MPGKERKLLISSSKTITIKESDGGEVDVLINGTIYSFEGNQATNPEAKKDHAQKQKRAYYTNLLSSHFENLVVLSGAGTSVGWGGKTMGELWDDVQASLTPATFEKLCKAIGFIPKDTDFATLKADHKELEKLLSRANIAKEFITEYDDKPIDIGKLVQDSEEVIHKKCKLELKEESPHLQFLNKITNRKLKDPRVKIFTLNYDTLFEQAAVKGNFTVIDGFSFSVPRTLSGRNFDYDIVYREKSRIKEEESFVSKVFHLYKPHGSINWELVKASGEIIINENTSDPLMIFPRDSKYENSYEQPFFEMMSRFQQNLRKDNVLLICLGFGFNDKHVITAVKEAVTQNPSFRLLIVTRTIKDSGNFKWFADLAKVQSNITIVAEEFKDFTSHYPTPQVYSGEQSTTNNLDLDVK